MRANTASQGGRCVRPVYQTQRNTDFKDLQPGLQVSNSSFTILISIEIKKCSLSILKNLVQFREDSKLELFDNGILDQCLSYIDSYPDEDVDNEILGLALDLISQSSIK